MTPIILAILQAVVAGLPEIEAAVAALTRMADGQKLNADELHALGVAMESAHVRAQGLPSA